MIDRGKLIEFLHKGRSLPTPENNFPIITLTDEDLADAILALEQKPDWEDVYAQVFESNTGYKGKIFVGSYFIGKYVKVKIYEIKE